MLSYVLPAASPGTVSMIPDRLLGWWMASVVRDRRGAAALARARKAIRCAAASSRSARALAEQLKDALRGEPEAEALEGSHRCQARPARAVQLDAAAPARPRRHRPGDGKRGRAARVVHLADRRCASRAGRPAGRGAGGPRAARWLGARCSRPSPLCSKGSARCPTSRASSGCGVSAFRRPSASRLATRTSARTRSSRSTRRRSRRVSWRSPLRPPSPRGSSIRAGSSSSACATPARTTRALARVERGDDGRAPRQRALGVVHQQPPRGDRAWRRRGGGRPVERPARLLGRAGHALGAAQQRCVDGLDGAAGARRYGARLRDRRRAAGRDRRDHHSAVGRAAARRVRRRVRARHRAVRGRAGRVHGHRGGSLQPARSGRLEGRHPACRGRRDRMRGERARRPDVLAPRRGGRRRRRPGGCLPCRRGVPDRGRPLDGGTERRRARGRPRDARRGGAPRGRAAGLPRRAGHPSASSGRSCGGWSAARCGCG